MSIILFWNCMKRYVSLLRRLLAQKGTYKIVSATSLNFLRLKLIIEIARRAVEFPWHTNSNNE